MFEQSEHGRIGGAATDELSEVPRHRTNIMRYKDPAERSSNSENVWVFHTFRDDALRQFEVNLRFAAKNTGDDVLIEIGVGEETDSHPISEGLLPVPGSASWTNSREVVVVWPPTPATTALARKETLRLVLYSPALRRLFRSAPPQFQSHAANLRAGLHLKKAFGPRMLAEVSADDIEFYLRRRLQDRVRFKTATGFVQREKLKPATVHQELGVLRRVLNVAVRKRLLPSNPCAGVEFPVAVKGLFRPHYMGWAEQQRIEFQSPSYLRNIIQIITETGLRIYKELMAMRKDQVDLYNAVVWIPDSKTEGRRGSADRDCGEGISGSVGSRRGQSVVVSE
jgi:hypothetical protein